MSPPIATGSGGRRKQGQTEEDGVSTGQPPMSDLDGDSVQSCRIVSKYSHSVSYINK